MAAVLELGRWGGRRAEGVGGGGRWLEAGSARRPGDRGRDPGTGGGLRRRPLGCRHPRGQ
ncbi:hypothetical protein E2562_009124 [Oryza meyeriana var. granulata]|uniref:Uncharacterized protein n=1 Tax=Oryza meyeriana var. granulata TaxID=110450 RepID=A0A6G1D1W8_9ORYZ|nr:hypothetical protein E2562_009124 [Oryza meyeriana var. granulata]